MTRRTALAGIVLALMVPLTMVVTARDALACSCAPSELSAQVDRSDVVFSGPVIAREVADADPAVPSGEQVAWIFGVDHVHKGTAREPQTVISAGSEASCGVEFEVGMTYLVFGTQRPGEAGQVSTGLCSGTRLLSAAPAAEVGCWGRARR